MEQKLNWSPFIVKSHRINNYTHFIALLKLKQSKYKGYSYNAIDTSFSNVLGSTNETINLDSTIDGFLHQKLKEKCEDFEHQLIADFNGEIISKIKEIKNQNNQRVYANKIGNLKDIEQLFLSKPTQITFKDDLLFDMYLFINQKLEPLSFLQNAYYKYVLKFYNQNCNITKNDIKLDAKGDIKTNLDDRTLKNVVREFVKMRFNSEEYQIEIYESRYLWAEVFVLFRIGRTDLILDLLSEFEMFFEFMGQKFKTVFSSYLTGRKTSFSVNLRKEDKFKLFLFDLVDERAKSDGFVINTADDFIWLRLITKKDLKNDINNFESDKIKFMIAIFSRKYNKAIDILLKSDFGIIPKFFLLRELCLEQNLDQSCDDIRPVNVFDASNVIMKPLIRSRKVIDDSSSTASLTSMTDPSSINPIFLNFVFNIVTRLSTKEYKVKLIEMLKNHEDYYNIIPDYIIRFELFDILGNPSEKNITVEFSLDYKISSKVLEKLRERGDRTRMMQLYNIIDDLTMIQILKEACEEAILIDGDINTNIVEKYINIKTSRDSDDLVNVYNFYKFYKDPKISNLKQTILFDQNADLKSYKFIIERLFIRAVEIVKQENDKLMAKQLFKLCGILNLNEECAAKISKDLVLII